MRAQAALDGAKGYLLFFARTVLFPLAWLWALALARRHQDVDPRGRAKVLIAIAAGVLLTVGGFLALVGFADDAREGIYGELDNRLSVASGESSYQDQATQVGAKMGQLDILAGNIAASQENRTRLIAEGAEADVLRAHHEALATLQANQWLAEKDLEVAQRHRDRLVQEHAFYEALEPVVVAQDDAEAKQRIDTRIAAADPGAFADEADALIAAERKADNAQRSAIQARALVLQYDLDEEAGLTVPAEDRATAVEELEDAEADLTEARAGLDAARAALQGAPIETPVDEAVFDNSALGRASARAFEIKDSAQSDLQTWMIWLLLPSLVGVFFAPLCFAVSSILKNAWEPSDSVGYKEYPGGAMGWFLLLGGFGVPALFFSAWTFWDMDVRSVEGQISL